MKIAVRRLPSGWWHVRGEGPENWSQPPTWPCDELTLREHACRGASSRFFVAAMRIVGVGVASAALMAIALVGG